MVKTLVYKENKMRRKKVHTYAYDVFDDGVKIYADFETCHYFQQAQLA